MKHNLNLLTPDLLPKRERLSAQTMLLSWALLLALLALGLGWGYWQKSGLEAQQRQLKARQQQLQTALTDKEAALKKWLPDPALVAQRDVIAKARDNSRALLARIDELNSLPQQGFSPVLEALAQRSINGLWLDQIAINGQQLSLSGHATKAPLIPKWVQTFAQEPALAGRQFATVGIDKEQDGTLAFSLKSGGTNEAP
ncbi:PilN domain-containing protein [Gallaecimonas pentaromativorans]|uniref:PilN domain-containing protein n=1 Tax=Gallaecimonas pentaromativorans TaxID=584787 RepID=UPI003A942D88